MFPQTVLFMSRLASTPLANEWLAHLEESSVCREGNNAQECLDAL